MSCWPLFLQKKKRKFSCNRTGVYNDYSWHWKTDNRCDIQRGDEPACKLWVKRADGKWLVTVYFAIKLEPLRCQEHSVDIMHTLGGIGIRLSAETRNCLRNLQIPLWHAHSHIQRLLEVIFPGKATRGVELISDLRLEPCLKIRRAVPPLSHKLSCRCV